MRVSGHFKQRVPDVDRDARPSGEEKARYTPADAAFPYAGIDVLTLLKQFNSSSVGSLTAHQCAELQQPVGQYPSPEALRRDYPSEWAVFVSSIPQMPAWKKRVDEQKERVSAGLIIAMIRGYHWIGGWLSYQPQQKQTTYRTESLEDIGL